MLIEINYVCTYTSSYKTVLVANNTHLSFNKQVMNNVDSLDGFKTIYTKNSSIPMYVLDRLKERGFKRVMKPIDKKGNKALLVYDNVDDNSISVEFDNPAKPFYEIKITNNSNNKSFSFLIRSYGIPYNTDIKRLFGNFMITSTSDATKMLNELEVDEIRFWDDDFYNLFTLSYSEKDLILVNKVSFRGNNYYRLNDVENIVNEIDYLNSQSLKSISSLNLLVEANKDLPEFTDELFLSSIKYIESPDINFTNMFIQSLLNYKVDEDYLLKVGYILITANYKLTPSKNKDKIFNSTTVEFLKKILRIYYGYDSDTKSIFGSPNRIIGDRNLSYKSLNNLFNKTNNKFLTFLNFELLTKNHKNYKIWY